MLTYGAIGAIVLSSAFAEKRARDNGNVTGALAAKRFGRFFLIGSGIWIAVEWIAGMIALVG